MSFVTRLRNNKPDAIAPDGSEVRILATTARGSMAEFLLPPGQISIAVAHHTVEEVWFFTQGQGQLWRKNEKAEEIVQIRLGLSISIPMQRLGLADDCTGTFLYLASDQASSYVTGQMLEVNGGQLMP